MKFVREVKIIWLKLCFISAQYFSNRVASPLPKYVINVQ